MNRATIVYIALLTALLGPRELLAHATLDHAQPKVGAVVDQPPVELKVWFTAEIEPDMSTLEVRDSAGKQIDRKDTHQDAKDKTLLIVSFPRLSEGEYRVTWSVVCTDSHHTHGDFKFTVKMK